jgi:hypothetical protein
LPSDCQPTQADQPSQADLGAVTPKRAYEQSPLELSRPSPEHALRRITVCTTRFLIGFGGQTEKGALAGNGD